MSEMSWLQIGVVSAVERLFLSRIAPNSSSARILPSTRIVNRGRTESAMGDRVDDLWVC